MAISVTSGINAIAHCVEALYARDANPIISLIAEEGIRALTGSLPEIVKQRDHLEARSNALYGAWLGGVSLGSVGMALHHKLCHTLGGTFNLPHAETHTVVLPHAVAYNASAAPEAMERIARALGTRSAADGLYDLAASLGAPVSLQALGMTPGSTGSRRGSGRSERVLQSASHRPRGHSKSAGRRVRRSAAYFLTI